MTTSLDWLQPTTQSKSASCGWVRLQDAVKGGAHRRTIQRWVAEGLLPAMRQDERNPRSELLVDAARLAELQSTSGRSLPPTVSGGSRR